MSSKRKKSKNRLNAKNSLGISRKKNYTKDSAKLLIQNDNNESIDIENNEQPIVNVDSALSYPYLKREILQIFSTFSVIFIILIGLIFLL